VLHQIGVGSLGPVFRAEDPETHEAVVIKQFRLNLDPDVAGRVAEGLSGLVSLLPDHAGLTRPIDAGLYQLDPYLVTALATGESLDVALREYGPAAIGDALPRLQRLADALDRSAAKSIWHGALQPRDILVSARETQMTGLGVAPILDAAGLRRSPRRPYAAPEIIAGGSSSTASDQYALAAITYEWLFGGRAPRSAESVLDAPALHGVDAETLAHALMTALSANPIDRFANCTRFVAAIDAAITDAARTPGAGRERSAPAAVALPLLLDADEPSEVPALLPDEQVFEIRPPSLELSELALDASSPGDFPADRSVDDIVPRGRSVDDIVPPVRPLDHVANRSLDDLEPRRSVAPLEKADAVAWQGSLGSSDRAPSEGRRGYTAGTLVAVLLGGLLVGGIAGYLAGVATRGGAPEQPSAPPIVGESKPSAPQTATPEREGTDVPVAAAPPRPAAPVPSPPAVSGRAAAAKPPAAVQTAQLLVRSSPSGAAVSVDGTPRGTTPLTLRNLALGTRTLLVTRTGYETAERRITLTADRPSRSVDIQLVQVRAARPARDTQAAAVGSLLVESRPNGAAVTIDGKPAGVTPLTIASITPGTHTVRLELDGYRPLTHTVIVKSGERVRVAASLEGAQ
jgi:serine/threonine protein kinase